MIRLKRRNILFLLTIACHAAPAYKLSAKWPLTGAGPWGALVLDEPAQRLYITRGDHVSVLDARSGETTGRIGGFEDAREVVIDPQRHTGYVADVQAGTVAVFDSRTLQTVMTVKAGRDPVALALDVQTRKLFVVNRASKSISTIDVDSNTVAGEISLPGKPESATLDDANHLFVTLKAEGRLLKIDTAVVRVEANWTTKGCVGPGSIAFDKSQHRVYVVCENNALLAADAATGRNIETVPVSDGTRGLAFDPARGLLFTTSGAGTLQVFRADRQLHLLQTMVTETGARTVTFDSTAKRLYLPAAQFGLRTGETSEELRFRPTPVPGSFAVLVLQQ